MPLPSLLVSKEEAKEKISAQIQKGRELLSTSILAADLDAVKRLKSRWVNFTTDLLKTLFSNHSLADEFAGGTGYIGIVGQRSFREQVDELRESIDRYVTRLESIDDRVELMSEVGASPSYSLERGPTLSPSVFISHSSQDTAIKKAVNQAFEEFQIKPVFFEDEIAGANPTKKIAELVKNAKALFVFLTHNSLSQDTRDWIVFEVGVAVAHDKDIHTWKFKYLQSSQIPKLLEQVTTWREFNHQTPEGTIELVKQVRNTAKKV